MTDQTTNNVEYPITPYEVTGGKGFNISAKIGETILATLKTKVGEDKMGSNYLLIFETNVNEIYNESQQGILKTLLSNLEKEGTTYGISEFNIFSGYIKESLKSVFEESGYVGIGERGLLRKVAA